MTNPYPLPRETRQTPIIVGDGRATYGPFAFKIWDTADVAARVDRGSGDLLPEAVTATKVANQIFDSFTVTFAPALTVGQRAIVQSRRLHERTTDVTRGGSISTSGLEGELSRQGTVLQELRRDADGNAAAIIIEGEERAAAIVAEAEARVAGDAALQAQLDADEAARAEILIAATAEADRAEQGADLSEQWATQAQVYANMVGAAVYDFAQDSDPELPGYDWSMQ